MDKRKSIDKDGDIISGVMAARLFHILVDDLEVVVVDVGLVNQVYVLALSCIPFEDLDVVLLYLGSLGYNIIIFVGYAGVEELLPLIVCEVVGVRKVTRCKEFIIVRKITIFVPSEKSKMKYTELEKKLRKAGC